MRPLPTERVAEMPSFVAGVAIIRGAPTPVVDGGALLGATSTTTPKLGRFVALKLDDRRVALAVDETLGVRALGVDVGRIPPLLSGTRSDIVAAIGTLDARLLIVLNAAHLLPREVWAVGETMEQV